MIPSMFAPSRKSTVGCANIALCSYGIFRLTKPPGLGHILDCRDSATFHQHSIDNIYTSAKWKPGHVCETSKLDFVVHDLRDSK